MKPLYCAQDVNKDMFTTENEQALAILSIVIELIYDTLPTI